MFIYVFWIFFTAILSIFGIINYFPQSEDEMLPLFQDITTLIFFLPSYFIITFGILPHFISSYIKYPLLKKVLIFIIIVASFIYSLVFLNFYSIEFRLITSTIFAAAGFVYFTITNILKTKINLNYSYFKVKS